MTSGAMAIMNSNETSELLGRLDERTRNLPQQLVAIDAKIDSASKSLNYKIDSHDERLGKVEMSVATAVESISPLKKIVFGAVGVILTGILVAALSVILTRQAQDTHVIQEAANKAVDQKLAK